jgi:hypothetical protein
MVYRAFDLNVSPSDNFTDVGYGSYYYNAIAAAKSLGIVKGIDGNFYPDSAISRQDAIVIILRTLQICGEPPEAGSSGDLADYSDAEDIAGYALEAMEALGKSRYHHRQPRRSSPEGYDQPRRDGRHAVPGADNVMSAEDMKNGAVAPRQLKKR